MTKENKASETKEVKETKKVEPKVAVLTTKVGDEASDGCKLLRREKNANGVTLDMWLSKGGKKLIVGVPHTDLSGKVLQKFAAKDRAEADKFFDAKHRELKPEAPKAEKKEAAVAK